MLWDCRSQGEEAGTRAGKRALALNLAEPVCLCACSGRGVTLYYTLGWCIFLLLHLSAHTISIYWIINELMLNQLAHKRFLILSWTEGGLCPLFFPALHLTHTHMACFLPDFFLLVRVCVVCVFVDVMLCCHPSQESCWGSTSFPSQAWYWLLSTNSTKSTLSCQSEHSKLLICVFL